MKALYCSLIGYIIGCINPAFILGKLRGMDIRTKGSGNAGASNAIITLGKLTGAFAALFDIFKAFFSITLSMKLFPTFKFAFPITAAACVAGHIFPVFMGFHGGKGLACLGGLVLRFDWKIFLILLAAEVVIVLLTDYICFVPLTASVAFTVIYALLTKDVVGTLLFAAMCVVMFIKHIDNIKRIMEGREVHVSYLWNTEKETERMRNVLGEDAVENEQEFLRKK